MIPLIRDRVVELRRVPASELIPNPKNWREHPEEQKAAMRKVLDRIGFAGVALARETVDGRLIALDGHLRSGGDVSGDNRIPVVILDLTEAEEDVFLATFDPLSQLAAANAERLQALIDDAEDVAPEVAAMLERMQADNDKRLSELRRGVDAAPKMKVSSLKHVTLKFSETERARFLQAVKQLSKRFGTSSVTDTVVKAVEAASARPRRKVQG